jgi:hypothetical protein
MLTVLNTHINLLLYSEEYNPLPRNMGLRVCCRDMELAIA